MEVYQAAIVLPKPRPATFEYLRHPANLLKMFPSDTANSLSMKLPEIMDIGSFIEFTVKAMGNKFNFVHEVTQVTAPEKIVVEQKQGPFKAWIQEQVFADHNDRTTLLTSIVRFEPPGGLLGLVVTKKLILSQLKEWVARGHELIRQDLDANQQ